MKTIEERLNSNGSSEIDKIPSMAYPPVGWAKTTQHVINDNDVAIWGVFVVLFVLASLFLWNHQSIDVQLGQVKNTIKASVQDRQELRQEVRALKQ